MASFSRITIVALLSIVSVCLSAFSNGGFEDGSAGSTIPDWTVNTYLNSAGFTSATPETFADLDLAAGGNDLTVVLNSAGGPASQPDATLGTAASLRWPLTGDQCALVNNLGKLTNTNFLTQTAALSSADVDPADGHLHLRAAVAPVLENPNHAYNQQPYAFINVIDATTGVTLFNEFLVSGEGTLWLTGNSGATDYRTWFYVDLDLTNLGSSVGDLITLQIGAAGCQPTGHWGQIYVDDVGAVPTLLFPSLSVPANVIPGQNFAITANYRNGGSTDSSGVSFSLTLPPGTTFVSVSNPGLSCTTPAVGAAGTVVCTVGTLAAGASGSFRVNVALDPAATGTVLTEAYSVSSTTQPAIYAAAVNSNIQPSGITGDPHFVGVKGEKYDVLGENNKWFNIITAADFQFNALFQNTCEGKTHLTSISSIAMNFQGVHFLLSCKGAELDGALLHPTSRKSSYLIGKDGAYGKIVHPWENYFEIQTANFTLILERKIVDHAIQQPAWVFYGKNCLDCYFNTRFEDRNVHTPMHGLLGQTASHDHTSSTPKGNEGQGEIVV